MLKRETMELLHDISEHPDAAPRERLVVTLVACADLAMLDEGAVREMPPEILLEYALGLAAGVKLIAALAKRLGYLDRVEIEALLDWAREGFQKRPSAS